MRPERIILSRYGPIFDGGLAHSVDPDQPFRPIAITDSGDPDHAVHYA
jgi:hypothetical protein